MYSHLLALCALIQYSFASQHSSSPLATLQVRASSGSCVGAASPFCCTRSETFSFDEDSYYEDSCMSNLRSKVPDQLADSITGQMTVAGPDGTSTCDTDMNLYCCTMKFIGVAVSAVLYGWSRLVCFPVTYCSLSVARG